jgi:hypothetical protein
MANTTFNGPVRSENGFQTISINATTGTVTTTATFGAATSVTSLAATTVAATGAVTAASVSATGNVTADSNVALVAGGASAFIATNTAVGMGVYIGSGAPTVAAAKGSIYLRSDGSSASTRLYVSDGSTTWIAVTTAS